MDSFFSWLFETRPGVFALIVGAILLCLVIAFLLERRTGERYFNHEPEDDDQSGWSFFDDDNV